MILKLLKLIISKDEQFKTEFKKISPFGKIPVITDHENGQSLFESGAILIYLAEKYNKFYEAKDRQCYKPMVDGTDGNYWTNDWAASSVSSL